MDCENITIAGVSVPLYTCNSLIIGSGAAALNCAVHLNQFGVEDILIVTETLGGGTSNNSGSDKQTYYKASVFGDNPDSVYEMARTLFAGGSMHGDIALVEATISVQEFYHLAQLGVPFPHNKYGGYVGYKTDHDPRERATSAGPWTSNQMFSKLLAEVRSKSIEIKDQIEIVALLVVGENQQRRVVGAVGLDKGNAAAGLDSFVVFKSENIIMGTGGPGGLYETSVYPQGHLGSTGVALEIGARCGNLTEWQYGIASTQFRWNLSGTYQQVIPRYFSTDQNGQDKQEFLNPYFPSMGKLATAIFLKGYQWPFDPRKVRDYGSSLIDLLVYQETVVKGRRVFMDFTVNPSGAHDLEDFNFEQLEPEALDYLTNSQALLETPIQRLQHMNPMAIKLYQEHGIDLTSEPLEIAVCAQHNNGGLQGNIWWESNVKHLFPVGEANGSHGVYRPGGTALNSGQCGSYRAAQYIAARYQDSTVSLADFKETVTNQITGILQWAKQALANIEPDSEVNSNFRQELQQRMSAAGAHIRKQDQVTTALAEARQQLEQIQQGRVPISSTEELVELFQNKQLCMMQVAVLESILAYLEKGGGSRGSYMVLDNNGVKIHPELDISLLSEDDSLRDLILTTEYLGGKEFKLAWEQVRGIPKDEFWFETVWNEFVQGTKWMD